MMRHHTRPKMALRKAGICPKTEPAMQARVRFDAITRMYRVADGEPLEMVVATPTDLAAWRDSEDPRVSIDLQLVAEMQAAGRNDQHGCLLCEGPFVGAAPCIVLLRPPIEKMLHEPFANALIALICPVCAASGAQALVGQVAAVYRQSIIEALASRGGPG